MEYLPNLVKLFAAESSVSDGLFGVLGIDWKALGLQVVAFVLLVIMLSKWVYPAVLAMLDRREKLIEDSVKSAKDSAKKSAEAEQQIAKDIEAARNEASDIIASAREQAGQVVADSHEEANARTKNAMEAVRYQLRRDLETARQELTGLLTPVSTGTKDEEANEVRIDLDEAAIRSGHIRLMRHLSHRRIANVIADELAAGESVARVAKILAQYLVVNRKVRSADLLLRDIEWALLHRHQHVVADVVSARDLSTAVRSQLETMLLREAGAKTVEMIEQVNANVVGGVVVRTPDAEMDATLATRLRKLRSI